TGTFAVETDLQVGLDGERAGLLDLDLRVQAERGGEDVEPRTQVRRGRGHADEAPALHQIKTARSTAAMSGSHGTTAPASPSAVSGSLRPWPVSTQTTVRA